MGCCGQWQSGPNRAVQTALNTRGPILFEYQGQGPLTVYGRVTGMRYHFAGPGARVPVDGRDAPVFEVIRGLSVVAG